MLLSFNRNSIRCRVVCFSDGKVKKMFPENKIPALRRHPSRNPETQFRRLVTTVVRADNGREPIGYRSIADLPTTVNNPQKRRLQIAITVAEDWRNACQTDKTHTFYIIITTFFVILQTEQEIRNIT